MKDLASAVLARLLRKPPIDDQLALDIGRDFGNVLERGVGVELLALVEDRGDALAA